MRMRYLSIAVAVLWGLTAASYAQGSGPGGPAHLGPPSPPAMHGPPPPPQQAGGPPMFAGPREWQSGPRGWQSGPAPQANRPNRMGPQAGRRRAPMRRAWQAQRGMSPQGRGQGLRQGRFGRGARSGWPHAQYGQQRGHKRGPHKGMWRRGAQRGRQALGGFGLHQRMHQGQGRRGWAAPQFPRGAGRQGMQKQPGRLGPRQKMQRPGGRMGGPNARKWAPQQKRGRRLESPAARDEQKSPSLRGLQRRLERLEKQVSKLLERQ